MKIFKDKISLKREIRKYKHVSFIPTMGGLHKGHVSLIKKIFDKYNKKYSCQCKGYIYRKKCRHITELSESFRRHYAVR